MNLIVAVDKNWSIGYKGDLLFHIKDDMRFFSQTTNGKVVVMGRKTLESLPNGAPLKNRVNVVLSSNKDYTVLGAVVCHSFTELFEKLKAYNTNDIFVIGGQTLYNMLMPYCEFAYVTQVDAEKEADRDINDISKSPSWTLIEKSEVQKSLNYEYYFTKYKNNFIRKI